MTESICYLHEFESHHLPQQDTIGIEIELPPTIDMVKQKRTATTTRSIKNRQRSHKHQKNYEHEMGKINLWFSLIFRINLFLYMYM